MPRTVILCDEQGRPAGASDLIEAHTGGGRLHLAFSVYIFNLDTSKLLIQRRSKEKMLWPLVWANACCSHPFEGESPTAAGERRLREELGFSTTLTAGPSYVYRAEDPSGRGVEHEYVTVLTGRIPEETVIEPDPREVDAYAWLTIEELHRNMDVEPPLYAPWFHLGLPLALTAHA